MIELLVFHLHIVGALYAFTRNWIQRSLKDGMLALGIIGLIFTIGWTLTSPIASVLMPKPLSIYFTKDTLSLILLLIPEVIFFYLYFVKDKN